MLKSRKLPCERCGREVAIRSKGLCPACRAIQLREEGKSKNRKKKVSESCLGDFFSHHITTLESHPYSELSGKRIHSPSSVNIAHIFPKRQAGGFPSIKCHPSNYVYLTWDEHNRFDKLVDENRMGEFREEFSDLLPLLRERIQILLPHITEEGRKLYDRIKNI